MKNSILQVYVNITKKCNLRCKHCYSESGLSSKDIDIKKLAYLLNRIEPLRVMVSGGEPLLIYKKVEKVIKSLKKRPYITLMSNGTVYNKDIEMFIKSNVDELVISLDSLNAGTYKKIRGVDVLNEVIANIPKFKRTGVKLSLNFAVFNENYDEIRKIIEFARKNRIQTITVMRPRVIGRQKANLGKNKILDLYKRVIILGKKDKIKINIHDPLINQLNLKDYKTECYAGERMIAIDVDLNLKTCPFSAKSFKGDIWRTLDSREFKSHKNKIICLKGFTTCHK